MAESRPSRPASAAVSRDVPLVCCDALLSPMTGPHAGTSGSVPSDDGAYPGRASRCGWFLFANRRAGGLVAAVPGFLGASATSRRTFAALQAWERDEMPKRRREAQLMGRGPGLKGE